MQAVSSLQPASTVEYVFTVAEISMTLGEAQPEIVIPRLVDYGLRALHQLAVEKGADVYAKFQECLNEALKSFFAREVPPFKPKTRAFKEELVNYLIDNEGALLPEYVRKRFGLKSNIDQEKRFSEIADAILSIALPAFFHEIGLMRWARRWIE